MERGIHRQAVLYSTATRRVSQRCRMVYLVSDDLLGSPLVRDKSLAEVLPGATPAFPIYCMLVRPATLDLGWLAWSAELLGPRDQALSELSQELCDAELDRITDAVIMGTAANVTADEAEPADSPNNSNTDNRNKMAATKPATEEATQQATEQANESFARGASKTSRQQPESRTAPDTSVVPLTRLSEFKTMPDCSWDRRRPTITWRKSSRFRSG